MLLNPTTVDYILRGVLCNLVQIHLEGRLHKDRQTRVPHPKTIELATAVNLTQRPGMLTSFWKPRMTIPTPTPAPSKPKSMNSFTSYTV